MHRAVDLGTLTIPASSQASSSLDFTGWRGSVESIDIYGPGVLTGSVKVQVSEDNTTWFDKQSAGADIAIPADGSVTLQSVGFKYLRVYSASVEVAERVFIVKGEENCS